MIRKILTTISATILVLTGALVLQATPASAGCTPTHSGTTSGGLTVYMGCTAKPKPQLSKPPLFFQRDQSAVKPVFFNSLTAR